MKINKLISKLFIVSVLFFTSCNEDDTPQEPKGDYENGILISGEGSGAGTGSVSFVSNDFTSSENLIYKKVNNNNEFGTYLQSVAFDNERAFVIVDAGTITVVDRYTFVQEATITTGLVTPRYMVIVGDKGYVTNWGSTVDETDDFIAVVDLNTYEVEGTIAVGNGPERIIEKDDVLYVSHKGAYTNNDVVSVIDISTKNVQEVTVQDNPDELFFNSSGGLVVLSEGRTVYDSNWSVISKTSGSISTINTSTLEVDSVLSFADGEQPSLMVLDEGTIYYELNGGLYEMDENATTLAATSSFTPDGYFYGLEVRDGSIYTLDGNFSDASTLYVYDTATKEKTQTISVGIGAAKIYFNN
ncbi:YncE family protein [Thalassobellus suaedae]|uniref:Cell surface protein n=1 Tax=Thalassobellus suaedae TaxID=3074124 RepID=A0ABY9XPK3_9FLAO|nr:cell surface protein [Flavobacteriaceae bacterium HL-DH14]